MENKSSTFCIMPHIALAMQNNGDISVCNMCKTCLTINGQPSTIDKHNIDQFWISSNRQNIIDDLDNNKKHDGCISCFEKELSGNLSARQKFNEEFKNLQIKTNPQVLIIKPGNTCNSACRTCVPETSSSLYSDHYKLYIEKNTNITFKEYIKKYEVIRDSFSENNLNFWPFINQWYQNLFYMDIYGGEPWLIPGLWKSLQTAVDQDLAKNITLRLHTNAMNWNVNNLNILSNFKNVKIGLSIDSHLKNEFNYIRHKSDFDIVYENSHKFIKFVQLHKNMECNITVTPSILNIYNLEEIFENLKKKFNVNINVENFVIEPKHYDIRHLPREVKKIILNKNKKLQNVTNFMNSPIQGCELYWPKFCMITDQFDRLRNQSFAQTFPEWYSILEPYWDYKKRHKDWYGTV